MPTPGHDELQPITHLSISTLVKASTCLRKLFYHKVGLQQPPSSALQFGSALHASIPTLQTGSMEEALEQFKAVWGEEDVDPEGEDFDPRRNIPRAQAMMEDFHEKTKLGTGVYKLIEPPAEVRPEDDGEVSQWEVEFSEDIGLSIPIEGRIDGIAQHVYTGDIFAIEYKTSGEVSGRYMNNLAHAPQVIGYPTLLRRGKAQLKIAGTITPVLRVSPSNTETAVEVHYVNTAQEEMFLQWARWWGSLILMAQETGEWPQNLGACSPLPGHHGAGMICPFASLCHQTDDWRKLRSEFEPEETTPITIKETE